MGDKVDQPYYDDDIGDWIAELYADADEVAAGADFRLDEYGVQSSANNQDVANRMQGNVAEIFHHTEAKSVDKPGSPAVPKQMDYNSGVTPKSTIEAAGHISSSQNRSLHSTESSNQSRRDIPPSFPAKSAEDSSRVHSSKMSVSRSSQQLQLPKKNIYQPSIHLFKEPNHSPSYQKQQPKTNRAWLQSSQESRAANPMGNIASAFITKHTQQPDHQSILPEMQQEVPKFENEVSNIFQTPSQQQIDAHRSSMQRQKHQKIIANSPNYMNMQAHQHLSEVDSRSEALESQKNLQQLSQPTQFLQNVNMENQSTFTSEGTETNMQKSTSLHSESSVASNQMKQPEESHGVLPENFSGDAAPSVLTHSIVWREQAYEQLQFLKEAHLSDVKRVLRRAEEFSLQAASGKGAEKYEKIRLIVEKTVKFLQVQKPEFFQSSREEVQDKMKMIMWCIKRLKDKNSPKKKLQPLQQSGRRPEMPQLQQSRGENARANVSRKDLESTILVPKLSTQRGTTNSQTWPINSSLMGAESAESTLVNVHQPGHLRSASQCASSRQQKQQPSNVQADSTSSRAHHTSMNSPRQIGSRRMLGKRASSLLPRGPRKNVSQNALNTPLEVNSSTRQMVNALDSIMRTVPSNPSPSLSPLIKQQEKYQMMQAQKMKHSVQPGVTSQSDERSIGQVMSHQRKHEQHQLVGQTNYLHRWVPSITSQHHVLSPQILQPYFPLVESMGISLAKDSITYQPTVSPVIPPPLASLHMSSALFNSKTNPSGHPMSLISEKTMSASFPPTSVAPSLNLHSHAALGSSSMPKTTTLGISGQSHVESESIALANCSLPLMITPGNSEEFHAEAGSHGLDESSLPSRTILPGSSELCHTKGESSDNMNAFSRLIQMVQSLSPEVLNSFAKDMETVVHQFDQTPGTSPFGGCREYNIDNSRYHWKYDEQEGMYLPHLGDSSNTMIRHQLSTMAPDGLASPINSCVSDDFSSHLKYNTESYPAFAVKRQKTELNDFLSQEVTEINRKLIETTLDIVNSPDACKGRIVHFSYKAVGHSKNDPSMLPDLILPVIVAEDYPHSSPYILDPSPDLFRHSEEPKAIWENTMSMFKRSLLMCSQPISLGKMASTWDSSAREAILQFAMKQGGGSFTSTYGGWEDYN